LHVVASVPRDGQGIGCDLTDPACGVPVNQALSFALDRPILPYTAVRQSIALGAGSYGGPFLLPSYDLFTRTVTFRLDGAFERNLLYRLELPVAEKRGDAGLRAFDGAPLEASRVPTRITFMTSAFGVPAEPPPTFAEPTCDVVAALLASRCASACCHGGDQPAMGLSLESAEQMAKTAIRRVAHQTENANQAGITYKNPDRFGIAMPIIDPSSASTSYLVYKLLVASPNLAPCSDGPCQFEDLPGARTCTPLSAEETERMAGWFVMGEPMPIIRHVGRSDACAPVDNRPLDCGSMRALERWIENGARCE
jgi:hypothetical protein